MTRKPKKRGLSIISEWSSKGKSKSAGATLGTQLDPPYTTQSLDGDAEPPPPPTQDNDSAGSRTRGVSLEPASNSPTSPAAKEMKEIADLGDEIVDDGPPYGIR